MEGLRHGGRARGLVLRRAALGAGAMERLDPERLGWASAARVIGGLCVLSWLAIAAGLAFLLS